MPPSLAAVRRIDVPVIDPTNWFCSATGCPVVLANTLIYRDATHMTQSYSRALEPMIGRALAGRRALDQGLTRPTRMCAVSCTGGFSLDGRPDGGNCGCSCSDDHRVPRGLPPLRSESGRSIAAAVRTSAGSSAKSGSRATAGVDEALGTTGWPTASGDAERSTTLSPRSSSWRREPPDGRARWHGWSRRRPGAVPGLPHGLHGTDFAHGPSLGGCTDSGSPTIGSPGSGSAGRRSTAAGPARGSAGPGRSAPSSAGAGSGAPATRSRSRFHLRW